MCDFLQKLPLWVVFGVKGRWENMENEGLTAGTEKLITVKELAGFIRLSVGTIHHWVTAGKIPVVRFGSRVLFSPAVIDGWVKLHFCPEAAAAWVARKPVTKDRKAAQEADLFSEEAMQ
jgi:excisionase family DNA binding protein